MMKDIDQAAAWINEQIRRHQFAEIEVRVIVHDGQVKQIERVVSEKIRPEK